MSLWVTLKTLIEFVDKVGFAPQNQEVGKDRALQGRSPMQEAPQG